MNIRVYYFGVLLTLFSPLGAMSEPCGSLEVDDLITNLLTIKELAASLLQRQHWMLFSVVRRSQALQRYMLH